MKKYILLFILPVLLLAACRKEQSSPHAELRINTIPENANITISGIDCGKAPFGKRVLPGSYLIKAEAEGYLPSWQGIKLGVREKKTLQLQLIPVTASILLKTIPNAPAEVTFQGKKYGQTPLVLSGLKMGKYSAVLKAPGCAPVVTEWVIDSPRPQLKNIQLTQNTGTLKIGAVPKNAVVKINGKVCGTVASPLQLEQGEYTVSISAPGYVEFVRNIALRAGKTVEFTPEMQELPVSLQITTIPSGADVFVNGKNEGTTPFRKEGFHSGRLKIRLSMQNYDVVSFEQEAAPGQTLTKNFKLESSLGSIEFVTIPAGVTVSLDGQVRIVTEADPGHPGFSSVCRIPNVSPGRHTLRFFHKLAKPPSKTEVIFVKKNQNFRLKRNVEMWIRNARIVHNFGNVYDGRIVAENEDSIRFEKEPGITILYKKSELRSIKRFKETE